MSFAWSLKEKAGQVWEAGYQHPFVQELGKGTLAPERFRFYLLQDYRYLMEYARVFALGVVKAEDEDTMRRLTDTQHTILADEMNLHRTYMAGYGVSPAEMEATAPSLFNRTYTANMLAVGQTGDIAGILATLFPCGWTYADYATRLCAQYAGSLAANPYKSWLDTYAGKDFAQSFHWFYDALDRLVADKTESQRQKVTDIFIASVEFEYLFWDMAYKMEMSYKL